VVTTRNDGDVSIHPSSLNFSSPHFHHKFVLFHEKVRTTKVYLRDTTMVGGYPLLLFAGKVTVNHERGTINIDNWIEFKAPLRVAVLFKVRAVYVMK
jgi:ATP-dependent RNA helicase DHX36